VAPASLGFIVQRQRTDRWERNSRVVGRPGAVAWPIWRLGHAFWRCRAAAAAPRSRRSRPRRTACAAASGDSDAEQGTEAVANAAGGGAEEQLAHGASQWPATGRDADRGADRERRQRSEAHGEEDGGGATTKNHGTRGMAAPMAKARKDETAAAIGEPSSRGLTPSSSLACVSRASSGSRIISALSSAAVSGATPRFS
jgi:hypothetical protein